MFTCQIWPFKPLYSPPQQGELIGVLYLHCHYLVVGAELVSATHIAFLPSLLPPIDRYLQQVEGTAVLVADDFELQFLLLGFAGVNAQAFFVETPPESAIEAWYCV